jgi:hypothetical protein
MKKQTENPRVIELIIDEEVGDIVDIVSFVDYPAIELDFMKFSKTKSPIKFKVDNEEQRIVSGPVMLHSKYIYRYDPFTDEEYYVYFSKETVKKAMELFMKYGSTKESNLNHNNQMFDGITVIESWIDGERAKSIYYDLDPGNWFMSFKVDNDEVWDSIKRGEYKGFSLEGYFTDIIKLRKQNKVEQDLKQIYTSKKSKEAIVADLTEYILKLKIED